MAKHNTLTELFTAIAASIRGKTGGSGKIIADDFPDMIDSLSTGGITPTGTKNITSNGSYDVTTFATAQVNVPPSGITPSGTKEITENGTYDVTSFASAKVAVPQAAQFGETHTLNFTKALGNGTTSMETVLKADSFIKEHYAHDGFGAMLIAKTPDASEANVIHFIHHCNTNIGSSNLARYGFFYKSTSTSAIAVGAQVTKISGTSYNASFRATSDGNLVLYVASSLIIKPGEYTLVLFCID